MSPRSRMLLLACALLGLGAASASSYVHYRLLTDPSYSSFCDVSATVSCAEAYTSRYGTLFGVPVAIAGVIFFALVLALAGMAAPPRSPARDTAPTYLFALSSIGLAVALYLAWASYVVLQVFCILCATTYLAVMAIWVISGRAMTVPLSGLNRRASRDLRSLLAAPAALVVAVVILVGSVATVASFPRERRAAPAVGLTALPPLTAVERAKLETWWEMQPTIELPVPLSPAARVQILAFSDSVRRVGRPTTSLPRCWPTTTRRSSSSC